MKVVMDGGMRKKNDNCHYTLDWIVTEARILGLERLEIEEGSTANFTCIISHPGLAAPNVTWYYNDIPVKQSSAILGGINIETEKSLFSTISKLVIVRVDPRNQGKYSCGGSAIYPAAVLLRIHPDRKPILYIAYMHVQVCT